MKLEPVNFEVEVISIEDDSDPERTAVPNIEDDYEITVNPMGSDGEDTGPISNGQPSIHPTGLFLKKPTSQDDEKLSVGLEDSTRQVPTVPSAPTGTGQKFWSDGGFNCGRFGPP